MSNEETAKVKKKGKRKIILLLILMTLFAVGIGVGFYFYRQSMNYFVTENARITTTLISIMPSVTGTLDRYLIFEGKYVSENEVIGWVEHLETFRSPFDGVVVRSYAVQNQVVWPMEPLAVIADISNLHIQANIEETYITRIQRGQSVSVRIDAFGNRQFSGYVSEIGKVTDAEITGNAIFFNTGGTFTKVTQLIPVKINLIDDINLENFIGLNARVRIALTASASDTMRRIGEQDNGRAVIRSVYTTLGYVVEQIYVEAGNHVSAGQILGVLDTKDLANEILNAEAALRIAEISLAAAEHSYDTRRILQDAGAGIPLYEMQHLEFRLQSAIASRQQAQAMLDVARAAMERSIIRSPIDGIVTSVFAREGAIGLGLLFVIEGAAD